MTDKATVWTTGYLYNGQKVSFNYVIQSDDIGEQHRVMGAIVDMLTTSPLNGVTVEPPGAQPGERDSWIGSMLRRQYYGMTDGELKDVVDFYGVHPEAKFRVFTRYINNDTDAAEIEAATGINPLTLPVLGSPNPMPRGQNANEIPLNGIAHAIMIPNESYNPDGKTPQEKGSKWKFLKWRGDGLDTSTELRRDPRAGSQGTAGTRQPAVSSEPPPNFPTLPPSNAPAQPPSEGNVKFLCVAVTVHHDAQADAWAFEYLQPGKPSAWDYTIEIPEDAGLKTDAWRDDGKTYPLDTPCTVFAVMNDQGILEVTDIQRIVNPAPAPAGARNGVKGRGRGRGG